MNHELDERSRAVLEKLTDLRRSDAPTHGGHVLSYVYDSGLAELDALAREAAAAVQSLNALDPTTFPSIASMERDVVGFARTMLHGDDDVVGSVTSGGTESCLLAVKTARDLRNAAGRHAGTPTIVAPSTVHAAFGKAAHYFGLELVRVPVGPDGVVSADAIADAIDDRTALVVVSAPSYPFAAMDPVTDVARIATDHGLPCHVDACIGGWVLPWWGHEVAPWDFRVPGVTSISADAHKYGYAPKGASILLHRGRDRQAAQFFATTDWPGYPVVNPTMLGSRSAAPLAATWAITQRLGPDGFARLAERCRRATGSLVHLIEGIEGLRVVGRPTGPLLAVATDESVAADRRVDPHHWADEARDLGWVLQPQPSYVQSNGSRLPSTTHLTVTPVTESVLPDLAGTLAEAADLVRGVGPASAADALGSLPADVFAGPTLDAATADALLAALGLGGDAPLPPRLAPVMALIEAAPRTLAERLLVALFAGLSTP
ncbi:glutamate/tyrosine decarboxylase-like PLP-dependent enzyme [Labedella gwakjiensis]|uniref:Aspartate aminotransferase family protein n=1 Tax=Labedella gwakjiensis TaxID=390269 RepID=A0A2P8GSI6_9MICO|nr:aminotransferase class V-fold PLP-dependent enzyme [Labedella gwakjiensis]PSL36930.1 glutamate/tyrosine decarboxylase-like PLP-dependent enzyme [Labedella gwakjiensis]RUQ81763.1 aspartate aminotransferase family protein [Labedella gwakjiensis]